jgi:hypothetical protein
VLQIGIYVQGGQMVVYGAMSGKAPAWPWQSWVFKELQVLSPSASFSDPALIACVCVEALICVLKSGERIQLEEVDGQQQEESAFHVGGIVETCER